MGTCKTCKHWVSIPEEDNRLGRWIKKDGDDDKTYQVESEAVIKSGYKVQWCNEAYSRDGLGLGEKRPKRNGLSLYADYDCYGASMATGEDFGCVLHEVES